VIWRINRNGVDEHGPRGGWLSSGMVMTAWMQQPAGHGCLLLLLPRPSVYTDGRVTASAAVDTGIHGANLTHVRCMSVCKPAGSSCSLVVVDIYYARPTGICIINVSVWTLLCLLPAQAVLHHSPLHYSKKNSHAGANGKC